MNSDRLPTGTNFLEWDAHCTIEEQPRGCTSCKLAELDAVPGGHLEEIMKSTTVRRHDQVAECRVRASACHGSSTKDMTPSSIAKLKIEEWIRDEAFRSNSKTAHASFQYGNDQKYIENRNAMKLLNPRCDNRTFKPQTFALSETCSEGRKYEAQRHVPMQENEKVSLFKSFGHRHMTGGDVAITGAMPYVDTEKVIMGQRNLTDKQKAPPKSRSPQSRYESMKSKNTETEVLPSLHCKTGSRNRNIKYANGAETSKSNQAKKDYSIPKCPSPRKSTNTVNQLDPKRSSSPIMRGDKLVGDVRRNVSSTEKDDVRRYNKFAPIHKTLLSPRKNPPEIGKTRVENSPVNRLEFNRANVHAENNKSSSTTQSRGESTRRKLVKSLVRTLSPEVIEANKITVEEKPKAIYPSFPSNENSNSGRNAPIRNENYRVSPHRPNVHTSLAQKKEQRTLPVNVGLEPSFKFRTGNLVKVGDPLTEIKMPECETGNKFEVSHRHHNTQAGDGVSISNRNCASKDPNQNTRYEDGNLFRISSNTDSVYLSADDAEENDPKLFLMNKNKNVLLSNIPEFCTKTPKNNDWDRFPIIKYTNFTNIKKSYPSYHVLDKVIGREPFDIVSRNVDFAVDLSTSPPPTKESHSECNGLNKEKIQTKTAIEYSQHKTDVPENGTTSLPKIVKEVQNVPIQKFVLVNNPEIDQFLGLKHLKPKNVTLLPKLRPRRKQSPAKGRKKETIGYRNGAKVILKNKHSQKKMRALMKKNVAMKRCTSKVVANRLMNNNIALYDVYGNEKTNDARACAVPSFPQSPREYEEPTNVENVDKYVEEKCKLGTEAIDSLKKGSSPIEVSEQTNKVTRKDLKTGCEERLPNDNVTSKGNSGKSIPSTSVSQPVQPSTKAFEHVQRMYTVGSSHERGILGNRMQNKNNPPLDHLQRKREMALKNTKDVKGENPRINPTIRAKSPYSTPNNRAPKLATNVRPELTRREMLQPSDRSGSPERKSFLRKNTGHRMNLNNQSSNKNKEEVNESGKSEDRVTKKKPAGVSSPVNRSTNIQKRSPMSPTFTNSLKLSPTSTPVRISHPLRASPIQANPIPVAEPPRKGCHTIKFRTVSPQSKSPQRLP